MSCRGLQRRADFRFLAAHTCVISSLYRFPRKSQRLNKSFDEHRESPRNLACRYITALNQWKAVACRGHIPGHSGLRCCRCRSIYRTLEPLVCASDMPPPASPSRVHPTRWERICRHCDAIHACECSRDGRSMIWHSWQRAAAFPYTKYWERLCACASLVIMVEVGGRMDEIVDEATRFLRLTSTSTIMLICMFGQRVAARAIKTPTGPPTCTFPR